MITIEYQDGETKTCNDLENAKLAVMAKYPDAIEFARFICQRANFYLMDGHKFIGQMVQVA